MSALESVDMAVKSLHPIMFRIPLNPFSWQHIQYKLSSAATSTGKLTKPEYIFRSVVMSTTNDESGSGSGTSTVGRHWCIHAQSGRSAQSISLSRSFRLCFRNSSAVARIGCCMDETLDLFSDTGVCPNWGAWASSGPWRETEAVELFGVGLVAMNEQ